MNFEPEFCRNESEVISKLIVGYLLPELGYPPDSWNKEVRLANIRLDFLTLITPILPFVLNKISPPAIIIEAKHPNENLARYKRKLVRYLVNLNARYGVLTNGKELKIYERNADEEIRLIFECLGREITARINDIRAILGKTKLTSMPVTRDTDIQQHVNTTDVAGNKKTHIRSASQDSTTSGLLSRDITGNKIENAGNKIENDRSKMRVISIYHNKGGVGKTTVSVNLAAALSRKGKRVLLIDMDAQANTTFATGLIKFQFEEDDNIIHKYVYQLLESGDSNFIADIARRSDGFNTPEVDVIPSHIDLIVHQDKLTQIAVSRSRLIVKLRQVQDDYDIVIIDTPPSRDLYAEIPLIASNYLIIPSDLKPFANQGLNNVKNFVKQVNEYRESVARDSLILLGVLPSRISTNSQYLKHTFPRQKRVIHDRHNLPLMESIIYERSALSASVSRTKKDGGLEIPDPKSIFELCEFESTPSAEQSAEDFESLAVEVLNKIGLK